MGNLFNKKRFANIVSELPLIGFSALVGVLVGFFICLYNIVIYEIEHFTMDLYANILDNLWLIPLFLIVVLTGAILVGIIVKINPMSRGSGIPQVQGAARGLFKLKWYNMIVCTLAGSMLCIFCGVGGGSEGPSMLLAGMVGDGVATVTKRDNNLSRHLVTAGASAGIATAFNTPLSGFIFAFEEAHKKFTPEIFICAAISVVFGSLTRNGMRTLWGLSVEQPLTTYDLTFHASFTDVLVTMGFFMIAAIVAACIGVAFYYSIKKLKNLFTKITFFRGIGKFLIPFTLAFICGIISIYSIGGGHSLMIILGSGTDEVISTIFTAHNAVALSFWSCLIVLAIRLIATCANISSGIPIGSFIPMLAIGCLLGSVLSQLFVHAGMDAGMCDIVIMVTMATFFASMVKAPLTAIVLVFELTGSYGVYLILPVMLSVAIAHIITEMCDVKGVYDLILDDLIADTKEKHICSFEYYTITATNGLAIGRIIDNITWPNGIVIESITRHGETIFAEPQAEIEEFDSLSIVAYTDDSMRTYTELIAILGKPIKPTHPHNHKDEH